MGNDQLSMSKKISAVFLDRDGVIVRNRPDYIRYLEDVEFLPGAFNALQTLNQNRFPVFIVTNQSAVGRGIISLERARAINQHILSEIESYGGHITDAYICPHAPADACDCRKPQPGLILQARLEHNIELSSSILIGDALSDLQAGLSAGIDRVVLVRTGRGSGQEPLLINTQPAPEVYNNLNEAIAYILGN